MHFYLIVLQKPGGFVAAASSLTMVIPVYFGGFHGMILLVVQAIDSGKTSCKNMYNTL